MTMSSPLQDPGFLRNPYPTYAALRGTGPVQRLPGSGGRSGYVVTGYAEAKEAFADSRLSKDTTSFFAGQDTGRNLHPAVSQSMLATDPPDHTRLRRLVTSAFTPGAVARLRPYIAEVTDSLLDAWMPGKQVDAVESLAIPLPVTVICQLLGVPEDDRAAVRAWSNDLFAAGQPALVDAASHEVAEYMSSLIAVKRRVPDDSLLTNLIRVRDGEDRLSEDELVSLAVLLLVAGHETTTNLIGNGLLALLREPGSVQRLREEPNLVESAVDELLRYDSPVSTATFRFATEVLAIGGTEIPAGAPVFIAPGAANRDPARFPDPDHLILDRDAKGHLAFGHGIHRCLGAPLARAEGEIAIRAVANRFPRLQLAVANSQLKWRHTRLMRGVQSLPVIP
jgi:cytochrome P450